MTLARIYLRNGRVIESVFKEFSWTQRGDEIQKVEWNVDSDCRKFAQRNGLPYENPNYLNIDAIEAISTIKDFDK